MLAQSLHRAALTSDIEFKLGAGGGLASSLGFANLWR